MSSFLPLSLPSQRRRLGRLLGRQPAFYGLSQEERKRRGEGGREGGRRQGRPALQKESGKRRASCCGSLARSVARWVGRPLIASQMLTPPSLLPPSFPLPFLPSSLTPIVSAPFVRDFACSCSPHASDWRNVRIINCLARMASHCMAIIFAKYAHV